ncbi:MAG: hypothetical protein ACRD12_15655, partial [Acidimicrobiales bacterium]
NAVDGQVLAEVKPDKVGNISTQVTIPQAAPDVYVLIATLVDARGADTSGTPARAQFQIVGGAGKPIPAASAGQVSAGTPTESGSSVPLGLLFVLGAAGLALFAAGFVSLARQTRKAPAAAKVRN